MRYLPLLGRVSLVFALAAVLAATAFGQANPADESIGGPLTGPYVLGAPFSAEATTTVHANLVDGSRLDQSTTDRYYRDSAGRVRVERLMNGLPAPSTMAERHIRTIIDSDLSNRLVHTIDAQTRTVWPFPRSLMGTSVGGGRDLSVHVGGVHFLVFRRAGDLFASDPGAFSDVRHEALGSRRIAGIETTGRRITIVVPYGYRGNDQPFEKTDERWESAELKLLVQARHSDSWGTIEYLLSNVVRHEPPAHLFEIPPDYTAGRAGYSFWANDPQWWGSLAEKFRAVRAR